MNTEQQINEIMDNFDFQKVHSTMKSLNWTWWNAKDGVPSVAEIKTHAKRILNDVAKNTTESWRSLSSGGLMATKHVYDNEFWLELEFVVTSYETDYE